MSAQHLLALAWLCFVGSVLCACGSILALRQYAEERAAERMHTDAYTRTLLRIVR